MVPEDKPFLPDFAKLFGTRIVPDVRDFTVAKTSGMKNCLKKISWSDVTERLAWPFGREDIW